MQPNAFYRLAQSALETWAHVSARVTAGEPADTVLQSWWRDHRHYGSRDRRFMAEAIFSCFRWKGWLDAAALTPPALLATAYLLDATTPHPSAQSLWTEAGLEGEPPAAGALNLDEKAKWLAQQHHLKQIPARSDLVPAWVAQVIPEDQLDGFISSIQQRPPLWLRARRGEGAEIVRLLEKEGFVARPHPRMPDALALDRAPPSGLLATLEQRGCTPQDISSQCVAPVCAAQPGQQWWDLCAGAGGKTFHLAEQLQGKGRILATEIREGALKELDRRARAMRIVGLQLRLLRPDAAPPGAPFDGILVDAPCSGVGTWSRNPDARWRTSLETVQRSAATQSALLDRAFGYLKPGGRLVFATCSVTKPEGADVVEQFLATHPAKLVPFTVPLQNQPARGLTTLWPADGPGIGMYIATIEKIH